MNSIEAITILQIILSCLTIQGLYICFHEGMVLFQLKVLLKEILWHLCYAGAVICQMEEPKKRAYIALDFISLPLFDCVACMASVWGSVIYFFFVHGTFGIEYPMFLLSIAFINKAIDIKITREDE